MYTCSIVGSAGRKNKWLGSSWPLGIAMTIIDAMAMSPMVSNLSIFWGPLAFINLLVASRKI
jgi:hypothetical protein